MTDFRSKKIVVTGGRGYLGQHLVRLLEQEFGVSPSHIFVPEQPEYDLRRIKDVERVIKGADIVFHLAALNGGRAFQGEHSGAMFYENLIMGVHILEAARKLDVEKVLIVGSATEYPDAAGSPLQEKDIWDGPVNSYYEPYAVAKKMLLVQARAYRQEFGFNSIHVLLTNIYGPGRGQADMFIPSLIREFVQAVKDNSPELLVRGSADAVRDFLYVEDAARGIIELMLQYDEPDPINLGTGEGVPLSRIAEKIKELTNFEGSIKWTSQGQSHRVLDTRKCSALKISPKMSLDEGLKNTIEYISR